MLSKNAVILQHLYYPFFAQLPVKWSLTRGLKTIENLELLALKVVAASYERWSLRRSSKFSDLTWIIAGILENWSLGRGGRNLRLD